MGLVQVLFEGSMMTWVVLWVPVFQNALQVRALVVLRDCNLQLITNILLIATCFFSVLGLQRHSAAVVSRGARLILLPGDARGHFDV